MEFSPNKDIRVFDYILKQTKKDGGIQHLVFRIYNWDNENNPEMEFVQKLDHSPYEFIDEKAFEIYVDEYETFGKFPTRKMLNQTRPLDNEQMIGNIFVCNHSCYAW